VTAVDHPIADFLYALGGVDLETIFIGGGYQDEEAMRYEIHRSEGNAGFEPYYSYSALLLDLCAAGSLELFAVGGLGDSQTGVVSGYLLHRNPGQSLENIFFAGTGYLRGVWRDPDDPQGTVFAVGDGGAILLGVAFQAY
jgi:hypothetical protein